jgi:hypothetical protein
MIATFHIETLKKPSERAKPPFLKAFERNSIVTIEAILRRLAHAIIRGISGLQRYLHGADMPRTTSAAKGHVSDIHNASQSLAKRDPGSTATACIDYQRAIRIMQIA